MALLLVACTPPASPSSSGTSSGDTPSESTDVTTADGNTDGASTSGHCEDDGWRLESGDEAGDDTGLGMGDDMPLPLTIAQAQQGEVPPMTWVAFTGVVITTPSAPSEAIVGRELFVQDPAGGEYSGLRVVSVGFDLGELAAPGEAVDLDGELVVDIDGFVLLRIESEERLTPLGPAPTIVPTPATIAQLDPSGPDARRFEGVVVEIVDATVTDDAGCTGEIVVDDTLRLDDRFVPGHLAALAVGARLSAVRGVFVRASGSYELAPPDADAID